MMTNWLLAVALAFLLSASHLLGPTSGVMAAPDTTPSIQPTLKANP